jgi:DNA-binding NarL/FixJ family response regulator
MRPSSTGRIGTLLVDDEADIRLLLRRMIEAADGELCVVGEAADGTEALACIDELDPDVVVLDQRMPGPTGLETAEAILARRPQQRIVVCSAQMDADLRRAARDVGVHLCLSKLEILELPDALRRVMAG